jgi:hypothetical protein
MKGAKAKNVRTTKNKRITKNERTAKNEWTTNLIFNKIH